MAHASAGRRGRMRPDWTGTPRRPSSRRHPRPGPLRTRRESRQIRRAGSSRSRALRCWRPAARAGRHEEAFPSIAFAGTSRQQVVDAGACLCVGTTGERTLEVVMTSGRYAALLVAATAVAVTRPSHAQSAGDGFLFHAPVFSFGVRGGFDRASAGSDVFSFVTKQLTLDRRDFSSATFGTNLAIPVSRSNDIVFDAGLTSVKHDVVGPRHGDREVGPKRGRAEVAAIERELLRNEAEHVAAGAGAIKAAAYSEAEHRRVKQKAVASALRVRRSSDRDCGCGDQQRRIATRCHDDLQRSLACRTYAQAGSRVNYLLAGRPSERYARECFFMPSCSRCRPPATQSSAT